MHKRKSFLIFLLLILAFSLTGCRTTATSFTYSQSEHWLALPTSVDKDVDIFSMYSSAWKREKETDPVVCDIDTPTMLSNAKLAFALQAAAFETVGNIYAPYYRQLDPTYALQASFQEREILVGDIPTVDAVAAFDYYVRHFNKGRPFILVGHSQGSEVLLHLLSDYLVKKPEVLQRMVAAYCIGCSVTEDFMTRNPLLKFAEGPEDTGVIVSYNTEAPVREGSNPVLQPKSLVINPISWTREETLAPASQNLGSVLIGTDGNLVVVSHFADAQVDTKRGVVICSTVADKFPSLPNTLFGNGVYHSLDYVLYYYNIRENAQKRVRSYFKRKEGS